MVHGATYLTTNKACSDGQQKKEGWDRHSPRKVERAKAKAAKKGQSIHSMSRPQRRGRAPPAFPSMYLMQVRRLRLLQLCPRKH